MPRPSNFWKMMCLILLGAAAVYFTGAKRVPLWDRDEPWYAQCSREMLQSDDWVVPRWEGNYRLEKPPVIYWLQAATMEVAGDTGEAARFPSTVATLLTALLLGVLVRRFVGTRRALWSVLIFCTAGLVVASAKFCITDATMMLFVVIGQACLAEMYVAHKRGRSTSWWAGPVFWISVGLAGLTKGPQALGMHLVSLLVLMALDVFQHLGGITNSRSWRDSVSWWRRLQPWFGLPILAAVVAPWLILIHLRAPGFVAGLFLKVKMHAGSSMEGHGQPPGFHMLLIFGTFFPWSIWLPTVAIAAYRHRRTPMIRFAIAAAAGPWLLMECVWTKLPFYVLPAFPALAFLTADTIVRVIRGQLSGQKWSMVMLGIWVWAIAVLGIGAAPWFTLKITPPAERPLLGLAAFSICALMYAALVLLRFAQRKIERGAIIMGIGSALCLIVLYLAVLPNLRVLQLSERLAADLSAIGGCGKDIPVAMIGYQEPSLVFYQGGAAREQQENYLQVTNPSSWPEYIVISQQLWNKVPVNVQALLNVRFSETGVNYAFNGRMNVVLVLKKKSA
jgi:4-amino-4-deoxy-L-arabinose transferase-like glycosyltransferase